MMRSKKAPQPAKKGQGDAAQAAANRSETRAPEPGDEEVPEVTGAALRIPVVGLGGSAGALDSFKVFFAAMPADSGSSFIVIQHLAPARTSMLAEILSQHTSMQVREAEDGMHADPNCVYVIPPCHYLRIRDGILHLVEPIIEQGIRMPIDFFFRSLAEDRQERAVCVLLSGAGSDGTLGVRAVRGAGGLTIAQDQTAQFYDMPRSAIATGLVDRVLPPDQMPKAIMEYLHPPHVRAGASTGVVLEPEGDDFRALLEFVQVQTGCDFRCYKKSTLQRRIERRMKLQRIADMARYIDLLQRDPDEVRQLQRDLLINVTDFFRDAEAFEELRHWAIGPLVQGKNTDDPLRVWVPGCSTGEEAYSLSMLLFEELEAARKRRAVQIFATDIDDEALQYARMGVYPEGIRADVVDDRLARFFVRQEHGYQVAEMLRKSVVFAAQNLVTDPPFSKVDIVSCRNLLIYLDADVQARLIPVFNFALNPGGYLFLGKSEGIGGQHDLFETVSKKARLFRRLTPPRPVTLNSSNLPGVRKTILAAGPATSKPQAFYYGDAIRNALLNHFAASVVLADRKGHVLQFHGQTVKYLNLPTGEPSMNLLDIAKEGLSLKLRSAMHQAAGDGKTIVLDNVRLTRDENASFARVTVAPIERPGEADTMLAVIFEDAARPVIDSQPAQSAENESLVRNLENELQATQRDLQSTIEELQAANEELRITNEEVISTNEELQSTVEELETSKEELQSVNEELITVNSQLQDKIERLDKANSDMANFLKSTQIATLFLDNELRVKLFTPATRGLLKLIPSDTGRPISDLSLNFLDYDLSADARVVAQNASVIEREVRHTDGSYYLVRVMPYRTEKDEVDGVIVTFRDLTGLRQAERQIRRLAAAVKDSNDAAILFDLKGRVQAWNRGAQNMYGWSEAEALRMNFDDLVPAERKSEHIGLMRRLLAGETIESFETQRSTKDGRVLDVWFAVTPVLDESGKVEGFATTERDITERKRATNELRLLNETLELRVAERTAEAQCRSEQLRQLAADLADAEQRERQRLTQILHDGLQQILVAAKYHLALGGYSGTAPNAATQVESLIDEAIETSRSLTAELFPPILPQGGLIAGLDWLARWMLDRQGLTVNIDVQGRIAPLSEQAIIFLFLSTRELLFNVIKHAGVMTARVRLTPLDGQLQIVVEDDGAGFDTSHFGTEGRYNKIGLISIRERIGFLGGRLEVESTPGQGSRVTLCIPCPLYPEESSPVSQKPKIVEAPTPKPAAVEAGMKRIRILLADDHIIVRQGLARLLEAEQDMDVVGEASDGEAAVRLARELRPDVVVMDINMPGVGGIEATRMIHQKLPHVCVVGLSMFEQCEQAAAMLEAGAVKYVAKSGPSDAVIAAIRACGCRGTS